jgi:hypothetical protein
MASRKIARRREKFLGPKTRDFLKENQHLLKKIVRNLLQKRLLTYGLESICCQSHEPEVTVTFKRTMRPAYELLPVDRSRMLLGP